MNARLIVLTILAAALLAVGCGSEATNCDDLDCSSQGRLCEQTEDTARCGDCRAGYVEHNGSCAAQSCQLRDDCPDDEIGEWSSCSYESPCSDSGERTRQIVSWSCALDNRCSGRAETEIDTAGCQRETEGDSCLNGSCADGVCRLHTGPEVTTLEPSRITSSQARLGGTLVSTGGVELTSLQLCYGTAPDDLSQCTDFDDVPEGQDFTIDIDELTPNTPHYVEVRAANDVDSSTGAQRIFVTVDRCDGNYVVTDDFPTFVNDYAAAVCPGENSDCDGACPGDKCLDFSPYPANGCGHITGHLFVVWNDTIETLPPFEGLVAIDESLRLDDNSSLTTLDSFNDLFKIGGPLIFEGNYAIESFGGFSSLTEIGDMLSMEGSLWPDDSAGLETIDAFTQLETIGGHLRLRRVHGLTSLSNFERLHTIQGRLTLDGLQDLETLEGLQSLTSLEGLSLLSNHSLVNLKGMDGITSFDDELFLWLNQGLETLEGLEELTTVGSSFFLWSNRALTTVAALSQLTSVGGSTFYISGNDELPQCEADALLAQVDFSGDTTIVENNNDELGCD